MWSAFLTRNDLLKADSLPKGLDDANIKKAISVLEVMNFSDEERDFYEDHLKWMMIEASTVKKAEEKAEARGKAEGIAEGKVKGKVEGEYNKAIEIAKKLLSKDNSVTDVADLTGLSIAEVQKLKG
jgi:predicted transposase/invertase (TIGR01784 family)